MRRTTPLSKLLLSGLLLLWGSTQALFGQTDLPEGLRINGLGRTIINSSELAGDIAESDSTTAKNLLDGEFLLDLKINAMPNEKTEVQSILRLRNEFGGFFGSGMSIEVRELFARGVVADIFRYHVGDMDLSVTPFTLYLHDEEGTVNEPEIFRGRKEVVDYEQFFTDDNTRRMQGGKFDLGLTAGSIFPEINLSGFFTRTRGTDFFTLPSRYVGGGTIELVNGRWGALSGNYVNTFDIRGIGGFATGIQNPVMTIGLDVNILEKEKFTLTLEGEAGMSTLREVTDTVATFEKDDTFLEAALAFELKEQNLTLRAGFRDVGPDFFSMAAQSKRVDFTRAKAFFHRTGNERAVRPVSLFDINRDRAIYNFALSEVLMAYDPRLSNTLPYGAATPNRVGFWIGADYGKEDGVFEGELEVMQMSEIRGQGTFELKSFTLARLAGDIDFHRLLDREEAITMTIGAQYESTNRGGNDIEQISLTSTMVEAGLQIELFEGFDLLGGAKLLSANGSEYIPDIVRFNVVRDFPPRTELTGSETMWAGESGIASKKEFSSASSGTRFGSRQI